MDSDSRDFTFSIQATEEQIQLIQRAARSTGKSVPDFILESACQAANELWFEHGQIMVNETQWNLLQDTLNRPTRFNPGMADLLGKKAPWEK